MKVAQPRIHVSSKELAEGEYLKISALYASNRITETGQKKDKLGYIIVTSDGDTLIRVWDGGQFVGHFPAAHVFNTKKEAQNMVNVLYNEGDNT